MNHVILSTLCLGLVVVAVGCSGDSTASKTNQSRPAMATLLAEANDFDLVDGTFVKIGDRRGHSFDVSKYRAHEAVVMSVWHSSGIIDNGGFEYLFSADLDGDPDYQKTAEAYKTAGLTGGYGAFQDAFKLFPNGKVPRNAKKRMQIYSKAPEPVREKINEKHWKDGWDELRRKKLAQFIRDNAEKFADLD